jgi:hypothetical protein
MQATAPQAPVLPKDLTHPLAPGTPTITYTGPDGVTQEIAVPQSRADVRALRDARSSLSDQITSAMGRRDDVASQLRKATDPVDRQGLEQRLVVLDRRIAGLENELAVTGRQLTAASPNISSSSESSGSGMDDNSVAIASVVTLFVIFPIVLVFARNMWRRGSRATASVAQLPADTTQRLERLEAGVEAIAIEVERISEGQRFVTKLLSEAQPVSRIPTLAEPERVGTPK